MCPLYRSADTLPEVNNERLLDHMMVYVTLCFTIRQRDVETHSKHCSTSSHDVPVTLPIPSVAMGTDTLLVSVTRATSTAATWAPFKVVTKVLFILRNYVYFVLKQSSATWLSGKHFNVYRSQADFQWLFEALQVFCNNW